jgi:DedD protein
VDILLKQRLVGAIVLISLAVIFLPMLFTGNDEQEEKFESSIPPEPVYEIKSPQVSVPLPLPAKTLEKVPLREPVVQEEMAQESPAQEAAEAEKPAQKPAPSSKSPDETQVATMEIKPEAKPAAEPIPKTIPKTLPKTIPKTTPKTIPKPEKSADEPVKAPESATAPEIKPSNVTGWVVQVGSFSKKSNAEKLSDKLRNMGMASFVVIGKSNNKTVYRVRVGPELNRSDAEQVQATIKKKTKLNGLVMKYP